MSTVQDAYESGVSRTGPGTAMRPIQSRDGGTASVAGTVWCAQRPVKRW
ncbi:hypothetical protein [Actinoplanes sp. NPDC049599]